MSLRAEQLELDRLHLATCTAGCRERLVEWGDKDDDQQAEADCMQVIQEDRLAGKKK